MTDYLNYLSSALDVLFRPVSMHGFWDNSQDKIIRSLNYEITETGRIVWFADTITNKERYVSFALMGVMQWRASPISSGRYDDKLITMLDYFVDRIIDKRVLPKVPSYGVGPLITAFSLAYKVFGNERYREAAWYLYQYSIRQFNFENSEDSLLLYGWSFLYEIENNIILFDSIINTLRSVIKMQDRHGLFIFKNPTTRRHQNQMYTLWGIGKAVEITGEKAFLSNIEKTLNYTIKKRMLKDGAFLWEDVSVRRKILARIKNLFIRNVGSPPYWDLLFECHQTFFVNAVIHYYRAGGNSNYDLYIRQAMKWVYGNNALNKNLVDISGIGIPMRVMTRKGSILIPGQMFKGAYELGSYIMALTNLITWKIH